MRRTNRTGFWAMVDHNGAVFGVGTSETEAIMDIFLKAHKRCKTSKPNKKEQ